MVRKSTYGLKLEQLTKILSLGVFDAIPPEGFCADDMIAAQMQAQLAEPLETDSPALISLEPILKQRKIDTRQLLGKSICMLLLDEKTDINLLQAIKTCGKGLSLTVVHETESSIGVTLYHGAIAAAMLSHDQKISSSSCDELADAFDLLLEKSWMLKELRQLFTRASDLCRRKQENEK